MTFFKKKSNQALIVGMCGRSCSGKGAFTGALASLNREVLLLQADCYFHKSTSCTYKGYPCWEHTDCVSFDKLIDNIRSLKEGKDTVIQVSTPWMPRVNVEVSHEDMLTKKLIVIDGFLVFTVKELVDLFDYRIFIDASDFNILRRRLRRDGVGQFNYINDVVIPVSKEYEQMQKNSAGLVIDGDRTKEEIINETGRYLCEKLSQSNANFRLGLPPKQLPWKVYPGDLLTDNTWHPIDFDNYKEWVQKAKDKLNAGEELKGNTFRYRRNPHSGTYEVRLSTQYNCNICRYTRESTPPT